MSNKKTLYIIGAGASREAGLPTGYELKEKISSLMDIKVDRIGRELVSGDWSIYSALRMYIEQPETQEKDINHYLHAAWRIRDAMPQAISIDNFIDTHNDDKKIELCGKLAIVRSILDAERSSKLYIDPSNFYNRLDFHAIEKTWYSNFMKLLTENCTKKNLPERLDSIALIVFNYDRCIEHFLYNSLQNYYGLNPEDVEKLVNEIEIYHPYGAVGALPWQSDQSVAFGAELQPHELLSSTNKIKTFTEGTDPQSSDILAIRNNVNKADTIVFLGFAYHELNMELLMPDSSTPDRSKLRSCFGTAKRISDHNCGMIKDKLKAFYKREVDYLIINNKLDCYSLFEEYWRSLSLN
jgi:hypothetical protein